MSLKISKSRIDRLGESIRRKKEDLSDEELKLLQEFRISYSQPLSATFNQIRRICDGVQKSTIVAFRLKRISTIINKVDRYPTMRLSQMGDIAGIRCIFDNEFQLYKVLNLIKTKYEQCGELNDYIINPKPIGYKGVHIYIKDLKQGKPIEIQLKTKKHHSWATLVEITDILYSLKLKEIDFQSHQKFAQFHALMSSDKELEKEEANLVYEVLKETNFITRLSKTFRKNNNIVKKRWAELNRKNSFFLLEASKHKVPTLESFNNFKKAEEEYFKRYLENDDVEIVLTSIRKPDFRQITIAYANYILSYHNFINDIKPILKVMALEAVEDKKFSKFKNIFKTYEVLQINILLNTLLDSSDIFYEGLEKGELKIIFGKKVSEFKKRRIIEQLNKELKKTNDEHSKFIGELKKLLPTSKILSLPYRIFLKYHKRRMKQKFVKEKFE